MDGIITLTPLALPRLALLYFGAVQASGEDTRQAGKLAAVRRYFPYSFTECRVGSKKTGKGRRKLGRKKRRMRSKIRHRK